MGANGVASLPYCSTSISLSATAHISYPPYLTGVRQMISRFLRSLGVVQSPSDSGNGGASVDVKHDKLQRRFTAVYQKNMWMDDESRSGPGSRRDSGSVLHTLETLDRIVFEHGIQSINDIPCGDFNWIDQFLRKHPEISYHGFDIVRDAIEANRLKAPHYKFDVLNIVCEVAPYADLILCKDLLNHLTHTHVFNALENFKRSGARLLLASNNFSYENEELATNGAAASRHLDILAEPFSVQEPIWHSGYLGLWDLTKM